MSNQNDAVDFLNKKGRFELKYIVNTATLNLILDRLRYFMVKDDNSLDKGCYINRSLYFDTKNFKEYNEYINGEKRRRKYRLRKYELSSPYVNFEIKHKLNKIIWKDKVKTTYDKATAFFDNSWDFADDAEFSNFAVQLAKKRYEAKCTVVYQRIALADIPNTGVRITFDYNLRTGGPEMFHRECNQNDTRVLPPGMYIMEVKFNRFIPNWCRNIVSDFNLSYTTYSKYAQCVERLYGHTNLIER